MSLNNFLPDPEPDNPINNLNDPINTTRQN
jgi:hypothetical protein